MTSNREPAAAQPSGVTAAGGNRPSAMLRIMLGAQMRRLREAAGLTADEAGASIRASHSKISRLEHGRSGAKQRDIADLLTLYGVTDDAERARLLLLAREATATGWWQQFSDVLPRWLELYVGLEEAASILRTYEVQFVHGLMQTADYARAVIMIANAHAPDEEVERRVQLRMKRQDRLTQPGAPELWTVLDEAALRRPPDGRTVMRGQLIHLLELTDLPNVTLQVVPFGAGGHAAAGGPFTILRFPAPDVGDVVYLEQLYSSTYVDEPGAVLAYQTVMNQLAVQAATGDASRDLLAAILKDY